MHVGENITKIRKMRGMRQEELARKIGCTQQSISKIEKSPFINNKTLKKISEVLHVSVEDIREFDDETIFRYAPDPSKQESNQEKDNVIEKIIALYERLLQTEREKIAILMEKKSPY